MLAGDLCQEDALEKEMVTHFSILAWRTPWTEDPGSYSPWDCKESDTTERQHTRIRVCMNKSWELHF